MNPLVDFGLQMRRQRRRLGLTQLELARHVCCTQRTIRLLEVGADVGLRTRRLVAWALHCARARG